MSEAVGADATPRNVTASHAGRIGALVAHPMHSVGTTILAPDERVPGTDSLIGKNVLLVIRIISGQIRDQAFRGKGLRQHQIGAGLFR